MPLPAEQKAKLFQQALYNRTNICYNISAIVKEMIP